MTSSSDDWPPHSHESRPWAQTHRDGTREDRTLRSVAVALPPAIGDRAVAVDAATSAALESAMQQISRLDSIHGDQLTALGALLLRTESVASSKIEQVEASVEDYARALHGNRANPSAVSMVAATAALQTMIGAVGPTSPIPLSAITSAHRTLMRDDATESNQAGRFRTVQNWIGGSDFSPRGALYVPPPPETVAAYMNDLMAFANRDDIPALLQAAIAHAQFESIHPFTDGNGRIGRALINTVLRRRGATTRVVVPLASALVARRDDYFAVLGDYRSGDLTALLTTFARSARIAAAESAVSAQRLHDIPDQWRASTGPVRRTSATAKLLALLPSRPILSSEDATTLIDAPRSSVFDAIARLREAGVLRELTTRKRDQVWGADLVLTELEDLGLRIAVATGKA